MLTSRSTAISLADPPALPLDPPTVLSAPDHKCRAGPHGVNGPASHPTSISSLFPVVALDPNDGILEPMRFDQLRQCEDIVGTHSGSSPRFRFPPSPSEDPPDA